MCPDNGLGDGNHPDWVKDAIFYQIFPDRFAQNDILIKPGNLSGWHEAPGDSSYHGGDLLGVYDRLDYLSDLGINAIYFNPIFQSASNHRYHTHDYFQVDPLLGGNEIFRKLVNEAHRRGIRIILDGVFNHASRGLFQFNDILENGPDSPWLDWFTIRDWPLAPYDGDRPANYASWWNNRALPKFNTDNPQVREFLMQIGEYWVQEFDIDGWRLDVPEEIQTKGFWEEFRERVKATKNDAYLVGEIWRIAPDWVAGDRFDALMNYPLAGAILAFTAGDLISPALVQGKEYDPYPPIDAKKFGRRIKKIMTAYDWQTTQVQFNLLASHDTARLLSLGRGDKSVVRLATLLQMTMPGAPSIYYGDEIGLRGTTAYDKPHEDPDARWPFPWNDEMPWDLEMLKFFKDAIYLRKSYSALRRGQFEQLYATNGCYVFSRHDQNEALIIALNVARESNKFRIDTSLIFERDCPSSVVFGSGTVSRANNGQLILELQSRSGLVIECLIRH